MLARRVLFSSLLRLKAGKESRRFLNECDTGIGRHGLVIGAYEDCGSGELKLSPLGSKLDTEAGGKLTELLKGVSLPVGKVRVLNNVLREFYAVAVAGTGPEANGFNESEVLDECKENIRVAAGLGSQALQDMNIDNIKLESFTCTEAVAEGSTLGVWRYQELKNPEHRKPDVSLALYNSHDKEGWSTGHQRAEAQNIARMLENAPSNIMTPSAFAQAAIDILCPCGVNVEVRDKEWLMEKNMTALLAMARGSCDPPLLLEMSYCGGGESDKPVILTGKGVTFDSGGLSLKRCTNMSEHRADMAGAAVIVGVLKALAMLGIPINVNALVPLIENMPGTMALKPGDIIVALNGKTIRVEDTDNEGRIMIADVLSYSEHFKPCLNTNIGTYTEATREALGSSATPVFSTSEVVWRELSKAGAETGDRVWRFPAWKLFTDKILANPSFDVDNTGEGRGGHPCKGAAFLLEFAPHVDFLHMDITGTGMRSSGLPPYLRPGFMTGRPVRTILQFLNQMACPLDKPLSC